MASVKIKFSSTLSASDPQSNAVVIIGQPKNLSQLKYNDIKVKFGSQISEETYISSLASAQSSSEPCPLYLNLVTFIPLPSKYSRNNSPSQAHIITKSVQSNPAGSTGYVVIVCERADVFASAVAVARAFPTYRKKTNLPGPTGNSVAQSSKVEEKVIGVEFFIVGSENRSLSNEECEMLHVAADCVRTTARIVDMPPNDMHTDAFLEEISQVAKELDIKPIIIRDQELERRGFGGIYGVGKAAVHPPALAILSHIPKDATKTIAWVGKGIVYDTGGLSIKGKTAMPGMKRDCGGAAAILGAFRLAVSSGFNQNLHAIFCLAENSVGPLATRPDDIHTLYSGRTVEINNTDAEGRLVLADGVVYAQKDLKADIILDMATLTGAQSIATGKHHAAILTNKELWEDALVAAGLLSGDLTFPIVFAPEFHFSEFSSAVADMKNSVADRSNATSSCAGLFILSHLGFDFSGSWIHVDIAAPVHCGERATGYGVALLAVLFGHYSKIPLLQSLAPSVLAHDQSNDSHESQKKKLRTT